MPQKRKKYTPAEKTIILKSNLLDKVPVSDLCDRHGLHPTLFYRWQKILFENMEAALEPRRDSLSSEIQRENDRLKERLANKDAVIAEIMEDYVRVKKSLGEG